MFGSRPLWLFRKYFECDKIPEELFSDLKVIIKYPTQSIESSTFCLKILNDNQNLNGHDLYLTFSKKLLWNVDLVFLRNKT